jgi:hypothetical protein
MSNFTEIGVPIFEKPEFMPDIIPIEGIDDWEMRLKRQDAFWDCAIIDRPVVCMGINEPNSAYPVPEKEFATFRERWMDTDYIVDRILSGVMNTRYLGDALPMIIPNLGPEVFSSYFGTEMEYSESTSWSIANLDDWADVENIKFSADNFYWKKTLELTDALLDAGKGKFYTGYTDLHPGGDALVAFRDPMNLNIDMIEHVDEIKSLLKYVDNVFIDVFNFWVDKLQASGQAIGTWAGVASAKRSHIPSNDFSCMISKEMFDDVFLPGITRECDETETSLYHLDGPGALQHLDSLLAIDSLNAIQWIYGEGNGRTSDWLDIYHRCQRAGKGIQLTIACDELDTIIGNLRPEGVWLRVNGVETQNVADQILGKVEKWK